jgi:hypothetical protein
MAGLFDMADGRTDVGQGAGHLTGDIAGAERDLVELGGLLLERITQLLVGLIDRADAGMDIVSASAVRSTAC